MKFKIEQSDLKGDLEILKDIVEKGSGIQDLSTVLIESDGDESVIFTATDRDVTLRCELKAEVEVEGKMCVHARKLYEIINLLPDSPISFERMKNGWAQLTCEFSEFQVSGTDVVWFPKVPEVPEAAFHFERELFEDFINVVGFSLTADETSLTLNGARFIVDEDGARMVSTDGHRLSYIEKDLDNPPLEVLDILIPKKALIKILRISKGIDGQIGISQDRSTLFFSVGNRKMSARKLAGTFPDFTDVFPKENDKEVLLDAENFHSAVARAGFMADKKTMAINLSFDDGNLKITSSSAEDGNVKENLAVLYDKEKINIGLNHKYVTDFLKTIKKEKDRTERVSFSFKDGSTAVQLSLPDRREYTTKYVIMPLKVV